MCSTFKVKASPVQICQRRPFCCPCLGRLHQVRENPELEMQRQTELYCSHVTMRYHQGAGHEPNTRTVYKDSKDWRRPIPTHIMTGQLLWVFCFFNARSGYTSTCPRFWNPCIASLTTGARALALIGAVRPGQLWFRGLGLWLTVSMKLRNPAADVTASRPAS